MNPLFLSPDIVRNICEQAYEGGYDPDCRATVAAFGAAHRSIHRVAVKVLWSRLFSLRPLVRCMPAELWTEDGEESDDSLSSTISLTRPPFPSEWTRFLANAAFVTSFRRFGPEPDLDEDTYRILCLYRPGPPPLLPNLRELIWEEPDADVFEYGYQFIGPKLTTLHLGQPPSDSLSLPILRSLHLKCPLLTHLSVQCRSSIGPEDRITSHAISQLQHLETVDMALPLFDDALLHLATLPGLSVAKIFLPRAAEVDERLLSATSPIFPSITSLHISAIRLEPSVTNLIRRTSSEQLSEVRLSIAHDPPASGIRDFLTALSRCPCRDVLSVVSLSSPLPSSIPLMLSLNALPPLDRPECALDASLLEPLRTFPELAELEVNSFCLQLDNALISLLANALPRLQSLRLMPPYNAGRLSGVTLDGLLPLFRHCHDLTYLALPLNATHPPTDDIAPMRPSKLLTLEVADSPISSPGEVAAFLSAYCTHPSFAIHSATAQDGDHHPEHARMRELHSSAWEQVSRLVRLFVRVRTQECNRIMSPDDGLEALPPLQLQLF
ncbi:hypothetical protein C2E23DRAFT_726557 [Lenzites betulinus]|nr:hypothetical protein C2E23DRAFT_726557 [Lenzites betulinus]